MRISQSTDLTERNLSGWAVLAVPVTAVCLIVFDHGNATMVARRLQSGAEDAAAAAVGEGSAPLQAALRLTRDGEVPIGRPDVLRFFRSHTGPSQTYGLDALDAKVLRSGTAIEATVSFRASVPTTILRLVGEPSLTVTGHAKVDYRPQVAAKTR